MHAPPPVRVTVAVDRAWIVACAAIAALAAGNVAAWLAPTPSVVVPAAVVGGLGAAWLARRRSAQGALAWDGRTWFWEPRGAEPIVGMATVAIDLDRWLLLAFAPADGARRWLTLSRRAVGSNWSPLRAALFGARPAPTP